MYGLHPRRSYNKPFHSHLAYLAQTTLQPIDVKNKFPESLIMPAEKGCSYDWKVFELGAATRQQQFLKGLKYILQIVCCNIRTSTAVLWMNAVSVNQTWGRICQGQAKKKPQGFCISEGCRYEAGEVGKEVLSNSISTCQVFSRLKPSVVCLLVYLLRSCEPRLASTPTIQGLPHAHSLCQYVAWLWQLARYS